MKTERRWMTSMIATATEVQAVMPWARGERRRPESMKTATPRPAAAPRRPALAAR